MIKDSVLDAMVAAGCTAEQIAAAVKADQARSSGAERQARYRARRASQEASRDVTSVTVTDEVSPKKEIPPTPPKEKTTPSISEAKASSNTPRAELETVLDAERAAAVIEHRQRLRKPLTAFAAKKLAAQLALWPNPNEAADAMLANGWQGFKPDWMRDRSRPTSTAPPRKLTQGESIRNMAREKGVIDDTGSPIRHLETSHRDGENPGTGDIIRLAVAGNHRW